MIIYSVLIICTIILISHTSTNNMVFGFFHLQDTQDKDGEIIKSITDEVNLISFKFQNILNGFQYNTVDKNIIVNETENYILSLQEIINKSKSYTLEKEYQQILSKYIKSLEYEIVSYKHFQIYLSTGNNTENEISIQMLSTALQNELEAFTLFKKLVQESRDGNR